MTSLERRFNRSWIDHIARLRACEHAHADDVERDHALRFSVPRIVAIGEESSGKSSTLERLAMLSVFPSDENLCTRVPIELRLRHRAREALPEGFRERGYAVMRMIPGPRSTLAGDLTAEPMCPTEVAQRVRGWMERLVEAANGSLRGVAEDRLVIELYSSRCVNLDLIDLPGIVAGNIPGEPADMMQRTRDVSGMFLSDVNNPHTFVIAVVSARDARIRNSQALELVQRYSKVQFTIGALTMADLAGDSRLEDPFKRLADRLNAKAEDTPELGLGYVALKNRDTVTKTLASLEEANAEEAAWFKEHLPEHIALCGIESLIDRLVDKVESYTRGPWFDAELARIETERSTSISANSKLGTFMPKDLDDLIAYYARDGCGTPRVPFGHVCTEQNTSGHVRPLMWSPRLLTLKEASSTNQTTPWETSSSHNALKHYDASLFDVPLFQTMSSWMLCPMLNEQNNLFDEPLSADASVKANRGAGNLRSLFDGMNSRFTLGDQGALIFVGKRVVAHDPHSNQSVDKAHGFFFSRETTQVLPDIFLRDTIDKLRQLLLEQTLKPDDIQPAPPLSDGFTFRAPKPFTFGTPVQQNPFAPSSASSGASVTAAFGNLSPFKSAASSTRYTEPPQLGGFRIQQPNEWSRPLAGALFPVDGSIVVLMLPSKRKIDVIPPISLDVDAHYERVLAVRNEVLQKFEVFANTFFKSICDRCRREWEARDARFDVFLDATLDALKVWIQARMDSVTFKLREWLSKNFVTNELIEANFYPDMLTFRGALNAYIQEILWFEQADHRIDNFISSDDFKDSLSWAVELKNRRASDLLLESCGEDRARLVRRIEALTNMRDTLIEVFRGPKGPAAAQTDASESTSPTDSKSLATETVETSSTTQTEHTTGTVETSSTTQTEHTTETIQTNPTDSKTLATETVETSPTTQTMTSWLFSSAFTRTNL